MTDDLRADFDHLLAKRGQRPALDLVRQDERTKEVGQVVGQRMKLKPDRVGFHRAARQAGPLRGVLALSDPLLRRAPPPWPRPDVSESKSGLGSGSWRTSAGPREACGPPGA